MPRKTVADELSDAPLGGEEGEPTEPERSVGRLPSSPPGALARVAAPDPAVVEALRSGDVEPPTQ